MSLSPGAFMCLAYMQVLQEKKILSLLTPHSPLINCSLLSFKLSTSKLLSERERALLTVCSLLCSSQLHGMQPGSLHEPGLCFAGYLWDLTLSVTQCSRKVGAGFWKCSSYWSKMWQLVVTSGNFCKIWMKTKKKASCIVRMNLRFLFDNIS